MLTIIRRDYGQEYIDFFKHNGVAAVFRTLCEGAAQARTLDMLGLEQKEKALLSCVVPDHMAGVLMRRLTSDMNINAPNTGIALSVAVNGIGGASGLRYLCGEVNIKNDDEVKEMKEAPYSLIIAIVDKGHTSMVMDAARVAGATGGTIVRAREIGSDLSAKFFGVSIAEEKEMVYIVTINRQRDTVLRSIMEKAGVHSPAHTVAFSLPVDAAAGLREPDDD